MFILSFIDRTKKTMKNLIKITVTFLFILFSSNIILSQTVNLGILESFEGFTGAGAVSHAGALWAGDVGSDAGIITGTYIGNTYNADSITDQCKVDLFRLYIHLFDLFVDYPGTHTPAFGGGETITPGVYSISSAGSLGGAITLDGQGDPNAFFVIKFDGAMTVGTGAVVALSGGTQSSNVFWIAEAAISVAANTNLKGTLFSHIGAVSLGANTILEGRILTIEGAITTGVATTVSTPPSASTIQIHCTDSCTYNPTVDVVGSLKKIALFTNLGAVTNTATSGIDGDISTNGGGIISGFLNSIHVGNKYTANALSAQAKIDLDNAYIQLMALPNTVITHTPTFGLGETLSPAVYFIASAGSLGGTITLDGGGDPNAVFVFKFAGAFTVAAQSKVILANGTQSCNVFWIGGAGVSTGAISIGAAAIMKGTFLAHDGACGAGAGAFISGQILSTAGAITFSTGIVYNNPVCITSKSLPSLMPIELLSFTATVEQEQIQLNWATSSEINNDYFNIERSIDGINFTSIDKINGAENSRQTLRYSSIDDTPVTGLSYYRLKQTDYNEKISYSNLVAVDFKAINNFTFKVYPNPFSAETTFRTTKNLKNAILTVYNSYGHIVKQRQNISGQTITLYRDNLPNGVYFSSLAQDNIVIATRKLVITN
jgi:hypothetical protein